MSVPVELGRRVQAMIGELVASGAETGLQVAVLHEGEVVVDAVAGLADPHTAAPVTADTLFFAASTGKGVATSVAHTLVDRGALSYEQRVADVWPEFSAHGKERVTLRDVLLHTAGVPGLWPQITPDELCDWDRVCAFIADQPPWWPPGTATGYHALTFGFVLGELVRRATGRTLADTLRDEIAAPLGVADELHFGVPDELLTRVARRAPKEPRLCRPSRDHRLTASSRQACSQPPLSPTFTTSCEPTSPPRGRCPLAPWRGCTPRFSVT